MSLAPQHLARQFARISREHSRHGIGLTHRFATQRVPSAAPFSSSALAGAAAGIRSSLLDASLRVCNNDDHVGTWPIVVGDWSSTRDQMETISSWPSHPLTTAEQLSLAEAYVSRAAAALGADEDDCGRLLCSFFEDLLHPNSLIGPRHERGAVQSSVVAVTDLCHLQAASCEVVAMLLSGHAVSLAAPRGPCLEAAQEIMKDFPAALLQAVEAGPLVTLPVTVRSFRAIGPTANELWADKSPPGDFGGLTFSAGVNGAHGMAAAAPFGLASVNSSALESSSRSHFEFNDEAMQLVDMFPGLDSDLRQIHDLVDLLWAFRPENEKHKLSLAPAHKHLLLTFMGTYLPEDVIRAAIISTLSPFHEPVTLHCVGLGSRALQREPLRSFMRLVQSGRGGLRWHIREHKDWAAFLAWLHAQTDASMQPGIVNQDPVYLFSTLRNLELEVKRSCAQAGGVAWVKLFVPELLSVLRRWTRVIEAERVQTFLRTDSVVQVELAA